MIVLSPRLVASDVAAIEGALAAGAPIVLLPRGTSPLVPDQLPPGSLLLFTSGSTGRRKGVLLHRDALAASAAATAAVLGRHDADRWLACLPLFHIGGLMVLVRAGGRAVLPDEGDRFDAAAIARQIERDRITLVSLVPTMLGRLLDLDWSPPAHLRAVLLGGSPASPKLLARAAIRAVPIRTTYGMTETCSHVAIDGRAIPGVELAIRGGRIAVRGPVLLGGYTPPDRLVLDDGWFLTADRGAFDEDGRLVVLGRADGAIITGGEKVDPAAVEAALEAVAGVVAACVYGLPDPDWGERVAASVVGVASEADIERALRATLAPHELPRRIEIVSAIPLDATGKVDRAEAARQVLTSPSRCRADS